MNRKKPTFINLITGPLGSGKTTFLRHLMTLKPAAERWVLLVNEFGSVGIDGAILAENPSIESIQLPGGCICCTAKDELKQTLFDIMNTHKPDRILIEPTGLGEPDTLVDAMQADDLKNLIQLQTVFAILDSTSATTEGINRLTIMQNLLNMADVVVLNKLDLARSEQVEQLQNYCNRLFPPKKAVLTCQQGKVSDHWLDVLHTEAPPKTRSKPQSKTKLASFSSQNRINSYHHTIKQSNVGVMLPYAPISFEQPIERLYKNELGIQSIGFIFSSEVTFNWKSLHALFESLSHTTEFQGIKRAKGVLKVGAPWMLFQWANQQTSREYISYRRDSRLELLIKSGAQFNFQQFEIELKTCIL